MLMFGIILVSACTLIHAYVFWRVASIPFVGRHLSRQVIIGAGVVLWAIFILGRFLGHGGTGPLAVAFEILGMNWMAVLFLIFVCLLATDLVTVFGFVMPRLILAGVEDLTARRRSGQMDDVMSQALSGRPPGGTIVLSHTPWQAERAAGAGAGLMLCGHTHGGQIWPFGYLIQPHLPSV